MRVKAHRQRPCNPCWNRPPPRLSEPDRRLDLSTPSFLKRRMRFPRLVCLLSLVVIAALRPRRHDLLLNLLLPLLQRELDATGVALPAGPGYRVALPLRRALRRLLCRRFRVRADLPVGLRVHVLHVVGLDPRGDELGKLRLVLRGILLLLLLFLFPPPPPPPPPPP